MAGWNFADVWEIAADESARRALPDPGRSDGDLGRVRHPGQRHRQLACSALGAVHQDKVAHYLYNCPEYLESMFADVQGRARPGQHQLPLRRRRAALPVGQRRRHRRRLPRRVRRARSRRSATSCPTSRDGCGSTTTRAPAPTGRLRTRTSANSHAERVEAPWGRSGDDLYMLYTGGTTGMPKGVMWRQDDLFLHPQCDQPRRAARSVQPRPRPRARVDQGARPRDDAGVPAHARHRRVHLVLVARQRGLHRHPLQPRLRPRGAARRGRATRRQHPRHRRRRVRQTDAARPRGRSRSMGPVEPRRHHLLGRDVERGDQAGPAQAPQRHDPASTSSRRPRRSAWAARCRPPAAASNTAKFKLGEQRPRDHRRRPRRRAGLGRGRASWPSRAARPIGYYKDPEKSATHVPGHRRRALLGARRLRHRRGRRHARRCSAAARSCINTGGEKVFPEEVEEALKTHPDVRDAVAVGVPDDKFGEAITAMVELVPGRRDRRGRRRSLT